jgi:hypothetical protein
MIAAAASASAREQCHHAKRTNRSAQFRRSTRVAAADAVPPLNTAAFSGLPARRRDVRGLLDV